MSIGTRLIERPTVSTQWSMATLPNNHIFHMLCDSLSMIFEIRTIKMFEIKRFYIIVAIVTPILIDNCYCIRLFLEPHTKRCLKHEMYANQLAVGEYEITSLPGSVVDLKVTDTKGHIALNRENVDGKGKFAFTSDDTDIFELCFDYNTASFSPGVEPTREVFIDYRVGVEAQSYEPLDSDKLYDIEAKLAKIEDITEAIVIDFAHLKRRTQQTLNTNDVTDSRIYYQSIVTMMMLVALACWQVMYLKNYFRTRKLID